MNNFILTLLIFSLNQHLAFGAIKKSEVFVEPAKIQEVARKWTFPAVTKSQRQSMILAENSGVVRKLKKQLGELVKKNEIIAWIENPDPVYQFKPLPIRTPIAGRLTKIQVFDGSLVERGTPLVMVTDPESVVVEVQVPAKDVASLKLGAKAKFVVDETFDVVLIGLSPTPDIGTLTAQAIFEILSLKGKKREPVTTGIQGSLDYVASTKKMLLLPESSLIRKNSKIYVRKLVDGKVKFEEIKIGDRYENQLEILSGLKEGEEIVTRTSQHVREGEEVQKVDAKN